MKTIQEVVNKRWSIVFAFIPGVNILFLFALVLLSKQRVSFYLWTIPLTIFPSAVVLHYLPAHLSFWGYYLFFLSLSIICFFRQKNDIVAYRGKRKPHRLYFSIFLIVFFAAVFLIALIRDRHQATATVTTALYIIASQDQDAWSKLIHPNCDEDITSVQSLNEKLGETKAKTDEFLDEIKIISVRKQVGRGYSQTWIEAKLTASGEYCFLSVLYLEDQNGEGIQSFALSH